MLLNVVHVCAQSGESLKPDASIAGMYCHKGEGSGVMQHSGGVKHGELWRAQQLLPASKEGMYQ